MRARRQGNLFGPASLTRIPVAVTLLSIFAAVSPAYADQGAAGAPPSAAGRGGAPQAPQGSAGGAPQFPGGGTAGGATGAAGAGVGATASDKTAPRGLTPFTPPESPATMVLVYCLLLTGFVFGLIAWDIRSSYRLVKETRDGLFSRVPVDQLSTLVGSALLVPAGIPGFARSLLAFTLLLILGIVVFHLVMFGGPGFNEGETGKLVHDLLMLLAGAVTSITGFYFGGKAVQEGASGATDPQRSAKAAPPAAPAIIKVVPTQGAAGTPVTIVGSAFGTTAGQVRVDAKDATIKGWSDKAIEIVVPPGVTPGLTAITVNPPSGVAVTSDFTAM